jgi:glyoxylate/hydroxypyruvate reductase
VPPAGCFARFPNLLLVNNLGAGIDSPLDCDDRPVVPISRLLDHRMAELMTSCVLF